MNKLPFQPADLYLLAPLMVLAFGSLLVLLIDAFILKSDRSGLSGVAALLAAATSITCFLMMGDIGDDKRYLLSNMLVADKLGFAITGLASAIVAAVCLMARVEQRALKWVQGETYALLLFACTGVAMIAMAGNLVTVFLGIETMSLAVYALVAARRHQVKSMEAAVKYFLAGAFASALLVFGIALVYGATGTTTLFEIVAAFDSPSISPTMTAVGVVGTMMLVAAFAFKIAAVPFHMWTPDAYEGAPSSITAVMASMVKVGAVIGMIRVFAEALGGETMPWGYMGWADPMAVLAVLTMTVANIAALRQENIKRLFAYSSISHAGLLMIGVIALGLGSETAEASLVYYLIAYSVMTIGVFAVIVWASSDGNERTLVADYAGLGKARPAIAIAFTIMLLSMAGMPPTSGFYAKFSVLLAGSEVYDQQLMWLVIAGAVNSAISIFYYLKIVMTMYFKPAEHEWKLPSVAPLSFLLVVAVILVLLMGVMPAKFLL